MRFPRLSHLFHRRVKSDGTLADIRPEPMATLPSRPASVNGIDELILASAYPPDLSTLIAPDAGVPVSITHPLPPVTTSIHTVGQQPVSMLSELKKRVRELEGALDHQYKANRRLPALERALTESRTALESATTASTSATSEASALRARLIRTQRALHTALTTAPASDDRAQVLAAENTALASERVRYHRFIELLISAGAHKPVLSRAYNEVSVGVDPEEALVIAIREALDAPDSPWTALLEPIIGPRTPEEYRAQVRATLDARKDAKNWRKRAKWWKSQAKEAGLKAAITPSPSNISSIVEDLPEERQRALDELSERRRGTITQVSQKPRKESFIPVRHSSLLLPTAALTTLASDLLSSLTEEDLAAAAASMPASTSAEYPHLAPLASQVFRASLSHNSSLHTHSRRSSMSYAPSLSTSFSFPHFKKATGMKKSGISASSSISSARSRRRRVEVVAVPTPSASGSTVPTRIGVANEVCAPSTVSSLAKLAYIHEDTEPESTLPAVSALISASHSVPEQPVSPLRMISPPPLTTDLSEESAILVSPVHQHSFDSEPEPDSDDELVIVMHADAPNNLWKTPILPAAPLTPTRPQRDVKGKCTPSPEGKSRLPVLKKAMRRLSISRPVLVDTTNAATFTFTRTKAPAKGNEARHKVPFSTGVGASPPRASRIPGMGAGRKVAQFSKVGGLATRSRKGTA